MGNSLRGLGAPRITKPPAHVVDLSTDSPQGPWPPQAGKAIKRGLTVVADAHVLQRSEELFFSTVHVADATTGQFVALGEVTYRLLEPRHG